MAEQTFKSIDELDKFIESHSEKITEIYLYEYYEEWDMTFVMDDIEMGIKLEDEEDNFLRETEPSKYLKNKFDILTNLKKLSYTSRFPSEMNCQFGKQKPLKLTELLLENTLGLNVKFLKGIKKLTFYNFPYEILEKHSFPKSVKKITIEAFSIEFDDENQFKKMMEKLNLVSEVIINTDELIVNNEEIEDITDYSNIKLMIND